MNQLCQGYTSLEKSCDYFHMTDTLICRESLTSRMLLLVVHSQGLSYIFCLLSLANFNLLCVCLAEVIWLEMILRFSKTSSLHAEPNNLLVENFRLSSLGNSHTLPTGRTDFESVEREGFLQLLTLWEY